MSYSSDASVAFKDADVVICIGSAREYAFEEEEYNDPFFKEHARVAKFYVFKDIHLGRLNVGMVEDCCRVFVCF